MTGACYYSDNNRLANNSESNLINSSVHIFVTRSNNPEEIGEPMCSLGSWRLLICLFVNPALDTSLQPVWSQVCLAQGHVGSSRVDAAADLDSDLN